MSTKAATQQPRRAPLSLSGSGKQHNQNQYSSKSADSNGNSNNSASAKNDKVSASQKSEATINDARESTPKDVKKPQNTEKKQPQQQTGNNETSKRNEKVDEKKVQNGAGKAATNGSAKEKQQNGNDKQENGNGSASNAKSDTTSSNGNATAKSKTKSTEKSAAPVVKEDIINAEEQKPAQSNQKNEKESEKEKEKEKKKENVQEKNFEKETRSRRHETTAAEAEKKQLDKTESTKSDDTKIEVASTPTSRSGAARSKLSTTPTRSVDKPFGASTPTKSLEKSSASQRSKTVTTVIDDVEMQPLVVESSPEKPEKYSATTASVAFIAAATVQPPTATSPGKAPSVTQKTKLQAAAARSENPANKQRTGSPPDRSSAPRTFTQIAGRRSIRPLTEYTPSKFQSNLQFRESYRRINTELDVSSTTNTSMNVTVGSEVPNNSSFSFFGRGRKRDRTPPPQSQSTMELHANADYSPPKRARMDIFFSVVSSPLTMLRSRFSKTSIQSSTPMRLTSKLAADDEVQNVSGISIEEEMIEGAESEEKTATEDVTVDKKTDDDPTSKMDSPMKVDEICYMEKGDEKNFEGELESKSSDVHEIAAGIADTSVTSVKNKRCNIM